MPIALHNVIYKLVTKIMASQLKPLLEDLIHPSQSAFVPQRSILKNVMLNHEIMCYFKARKGKKCYIYEG